MMSFSTSGFPGILVPLMNQLRIIPQLRIVGRVVMAEIARKQVAAEIARKQVDFAS
jgi:hypothetical protein